MSVKGNCEVKTRSGSLRKLSEKTGCMLGRKTKQSMPPKEMNVWLARERQLTVPNHTEESSEGHVTCDLIRRVGEEEGRAGESP